MSENQVEAIEKRNKEYLENLQGNIGKYFSFLSTMARFHKYEVKDLASFALEAPRWQVRNFGKNISIEKSAQKQEESLS